MPSPGETGQNRKKKKGRKRHWDADWKQQSNACGIILPIALHSSSTYQRKLSIFACNMRVFPLSKRTKPGRPEPELCAWRARREGGGWAAMDKRVSLPCAWLIGARVRVWKASPFATYRYPGRLNHASRVSPFGRTLLSKRDEKKQGSKRQKRVSACLPTFCPCLI